MYDGRPLRSTWDQAPWGDPLVLLRKEVIQPHLPVRLPCYDFIPLTKHTFGTSLLCRLGQ